MHPSLPRALTDYLFTTTSYGMLRSPPLKGSPQLPLYEDKPEPSRLAASVRSLARRKFVAILLLVACGYYVARASEDVATSAGVDLWTPLRDFAPLRSWTASSHAGGVEVDLRVWQNGDLPSAFVPFWAPPADPDVRCDYCDCTTDPSMPRLPANRRTALPLASYASLPGYVHSTLLDTYCRGVYMLPNYTESINHPPVLLDSIATLVQRAWQKPDQVFSWRMDGLELGKATSYIFTKTSMLARTASKRPRYLDRTAAAIRLHRDNASKRGHADGTPASERQLIWIIVEDGPHIDPEVAALLASADLPFIYTSFGPTTHYGNAQHNTALTMIHALSNSEAGGLGHGPIVSVDDDAEVTAELFDIIWAVRRIGCWPMGNLGPTGWEGPVVENGRLIDWPAWQEWRKFPLDNGAFAFHSSLLGTTLPGPRFWPTDIEGGESEFISLLVDTREEIEFLCPDGCMVAWHNQLNL